MPGLLQADDYARALLERHPNVTPEQVTERVAGRLARQAVLDRTEPPLLWALVDENVLHREIGGPEVMSDQLGHLAGIARRPNVAVQVIPRTGAHVGLSGAFVMAETPESQVAYLDNIVDGMTADSPAIVTQVSTRFDTLRTDATGEPTVGSDDWRTSSYSGTRGNCIEVSGAVSAVLVRDTRNRDGAALCIPENAWASFTASLK